MKTKKNLIVVLAIIICASSIFFSYAYFIRVTTSNNVISFGTLKLKLINNYLVDGKEVPIDSSNVIDITNNSEVSRIVRVENIGKHPMFVRIYLDVIMNNQKIDDGLVDDYMTFNLNDNWIYQDGYFYYRYILDPEEETENLFTKINFDVSKIKSDGHSGKVDLKVNVEVIQSENNAKSVLEAEGWPEKN